MLGEHVYSLKITSFRASYLQAFRVFFQHTKRLYQVMKTGKMSCIALMSICTRSLANWTTNLSSFCDQVGDSQ